MIIFENEYCEDDLVELDSLFVGDTGIIRESFDEKDIGEIILMCENEQVVTLGPFERYVWPELDKDYWESIKVQVVDLKVKIKEMK